MHERRLIIAELETAERVLREKCDRLRDYAQRTKSGEINVHHLTNAVIKIANEIAEPETR